MANGYSDFFTKFITYFGAASPTDFMTFLGHIADIFLLLGGSMIVGFAAYVWKKENLHEELSQGYDGYKGSFVQKALNFTIAYFTPFVLFAMFILVVLSNFFGLDTI